jgi:amino acid adenylation domain-containing protein
MDQQVDQRVGQRATLAQSGIWVTEVAGRAGAGYVMPLAVELTGPVDVSALRDACAAVLDRHRVLGSVVEERDGVPVLVPGPVAPAVTVEYGPPPADVEPFDLAAGPLVRVGLHVLGENRCLLRLTAHHLVFDGESKSIFMRDLAAAYAGAELAPLPAVDLAADEELRIDEQLPLAREYWRARWREPAEVRLPYLTGTVPPTGPGASVDLTLDDDLHAGLDALGVSRFEVVLAAWQALLWWYGNGTGAGTGQDEAVAVGIDLGTRTDDTRDRIGCFANELPVFSRLAPDWSFRRLAQSLAFEHGLRRDLRGLYRVREVPLARVLPRIDPDRVLAPVSLSYRRRDATPQLAGLATEVDWVSFNGTSRGALRVVVVDGPDRCDVSLQYSPAHLPDEAAARVAGHWRALLRTALAAPDTALADLLTEPPVTHDTARDYPATTVVDLVDRVAARQPDSTAVVDRERSLTYRELGDATRALAGRLVAAGAGPGSLVALLADRSADALVAQLAVLRAGAAYVPLDPAHPAVRLEFVLDDARPHALLVLDRLRAAAPAFDGPVLVLGELAEAGPAQGGAAESGAAESGATESGSTGSAATGARAARGDAGELPGPSPSDRAYVLYTSGSTGQPKGVEIGHGALTNLLFAVRDELADPGPPVWLALTSLAFDISALELYLPLVTGGRVVVAPDELNLDGAALAALIAEQGVTHVQATPSGWQVLVDGGFADPRVTALAGGEALPQPLADAIRARSDRLFNMYGPTETTIWSTCAAVTGPVTIGRPLANTTVHITDDALRAVPAGVPGELCIGGAGLASGYLGRPELTAQRFVTGPAGERVYRTGDLARYRPDGELEFLGRVDGQVKLRGHRIELGEIEARLLAHPAVGRAAVAVRDERLVAYLVPAAPAGADRPGVALDPAQVREELARFLPAVMVPALFVELDELPLTPNGKLDRRALPEPTVTPPPAPAASVSYTGPAAQVHEIVRGVLRVDEIGPEDDLFELGIHSLMITQILVRLRGTLQADLPLHVFYDVPTISGLTAEVERVLAREIA